MSDQGTDRGTGGTGSGADDTGGSSADETSGSDGDGVEAGYTTPGELADDPDPTDPTD